MSESEGYSGSPFGRANLDPFSIWGGNDGFRQVLDVAQKLGVML